MQYAFAFITKRYIASRQVFAVIGCQPHVSDYCYHSILKECLFLAYVVGLNIGSSASK